MTFDRHAFWRNPDASNQPEGIKGICKPQFYLDLHDITLLIVDTLKRHLDNKDSIMELGAGTGRNLAGLKFAGFTKVKGIEINPEAIELGRKSFELGDVEIMCDTVEDAIDKMSKFDCIFTQGLLQHLSPDTDWIHKKIAGKANKLIVTIENEQPVGVRSWARNYKDIFEGLGWHEVECKDNTGCKGHAPTTTVRVFKK
jgi:SAM-dependent methyltransferase